MPFCPSELMAPAATPRPIRKALISQYGDESNISVVDGELPAPPAKHVQVEVLYSGFAGSDVNMRLGTYPLQKSAPLTPGYSLVGRIVSLGPQCTSGLQVGDVVGAVTVYDSEATRANLAEKYAVRVPGAVHDLGQATALALDWATAFGMVTRAANVQKGQRVFVHGLSGAVGHATMQLALRAGAEVYGTASERNHASLRRQGAHPFVYTDKSWIAAMHERGGAHAVFDPLGFTSWDESFSILAPSGILVGYGGNAGALGVNGERKSVLGPTLKLFARGLNPFSSAKTNFYYISRDSKHYRADFEALLELLAQGEISPVIKSVHDLENIQEAHRVWGKAPGMGSMLIKVA